MLAFSKPLKVIFSIFTMSGFVEFDDTIGISRGSLNTVSKDILGRQLVVFAPSHTALVLRDHFAKNSTHIVPQPPYSPYLAPCDFWLLPKFKRPLRGHRFNTFEKIRAESKKALKVIPEIEFNKCFEDRKKRWHKCIISGGDHFEGDEIDLDR